MNLNSLIIAADTSRARLFRTAQTGTVPTPVELLEVEAIERGERSSANAEAPESCLAEGRRFSTEGPGHVSDTIQSHRDDELRAFARQVASRAAAFAQYHFCNPIIVSATHGVSPLLLAELERELPHVYVRALTGEMASLPGPELLDALRERGAFTPVQYPAHS